MLPRLLGHFFFSITTEIDIGFNLPSGSLSLGRQSQSPLRVMRGKDYVGKREREVTRNSIQRPASLSQRSFQNKGQKV